MTNPDPNIAAIEANLSEEDKQKIASGDYVLDPIFGVQPKVPVDTDGNAIPDAISSQDSAAAQLPQDTTPAPQPAPQPAPVPQPQPQDPNA